MMVWSVNKCFSLVQKIHRYNFIGKGACTSIGSRTGSAFSTCIPVPTRGVKLHPIPLVPSALSQVKTFHSSKACLGLEEFIEEKKPNEYVATGRSWTACDLRKKVY